MKKIAVLAAGHGLNDCIAGYILGNLVSMGLPLFDAGMAIFIYNLIAFGGQMVFAVLAKYKPFPKSWLLLCYAFLAGGMLLLHSNYQLSVWLVAFSSMIIHVIGGHESSANEKQASALGIFAAPGVIGLILGGWLAFIHYDLMWTGIAGCAVLAVATFLLRFSAAAEAPEEKSGADRHDVIMIVLLAVISLRSAIWDVFQLLYENRYDILLPVAIAAMAGKITGGFLGDRIGHRRQSIWALSLSLPLLSFNRQNIPLLCTGIFLLQSSLPNLSRLLINQLRSDRHMGAALTFGLPIILGALFFFSPLKTYADSTLAIVLLHLLCLLLLFLLGRKKKAAALQS